MFSRSLLIAALIGIIGSSTALARSPTGRVTSSVIKTSTQTTQQIIKNMRTVIPGRPVRRGGCEEWACGSSNGTKLTGLVQETVVATEAVVTSVMLPSGETIDLR